MKFDDILTGSQVFVDANVFLYYFTAHPAYGRACETLLDRIEIADIQGFSSCHVIGEVVHRLMTLEAAFITQPGD